MKNLENRLKWKDKKLRNQDNHNLLNQYVKYMKYCLEVGFFYNEARKYVPTMVKYKK